jgi:hypothetical protein
MAFGSLAIQVASIRVLTNLPQEVQITYDSRKGPWDKTLLQVWPIIQHSQQWPPGYGLDGEYGLETLTERLSPETNGQS